MTYRGSLILRIIASAMAAWISTFLIPRTQKLSKEKCVGFIDEVDVPKSTYRLTDVEFRQIIRADMFVLEASLSVLITNYFSGLINPKLLSDDGSA